MPEPNAARREKRQASSAAFLIKVARDFSTANERESTRMKIHCQEAF
jgi:hypothetical protein